MKVGDIITRYELAKKAGLKLELLDCSAKYLSKKKKRSTLELFGKEQHLL